MLYQRVFCGRAGSHGTLASFRASCSPPQLGCCSGALPAQGGQHGGLLVTAPADGWMGCHLQGAESRPDWLHCELLQSCPCKAATAHRRAGKTLHLSRQLCSAYYMRHDCFCYTFTGIRKRHLPAPHFQCPTYQLHPWCLQVGLTALFLSRGHFHSEKTKRTLRVP